MSQYRSYAQAVAYFDVASSAISLWLLLGLFSDALNDIGDEETTDWFLYAAFAICGVISLQLLAATRLFEATQIDQEPVTALHLACTWIIITLVIFIIDFISLVSLGLMAGIVAAIHLLLRGGMTIYMVRPYMEELEMMITSAPVSVTVQK